MFRTWIRLPPSRRRQWLGFLWGRLFTSLIHARRLKNCGYGTIVQRPLFWTPEFIELGEKVHIWPGARIEAVESYGKDRFQPLIRIGDRTTFQQNCHLVAAAELHIGKDCTFSLDVLVTDNDHQFDVQGVNVLAQPLIVRRTRIGDYCFIGAGARIHAGTELGNHCVVGANAVVRGSFPDHCVIVGVPARIIKRRDPKTETWRKTDADGRFVV
jgi:acetyltransferase-like isoleucine patch superfamily enzyme